MSRHEVENILKIALSTNWCNERLASGEAIADAAAELGFDALELGFRTTLEQVAGFRSRLDKMPVASVHAFAPVPISAPFGHPELYLLASFNDEARRMALLQTTRVVEFAASLGATAVVLHAGRVHCETFLARNRIKKRIRRGRELLAAFHPTLEALIPVLERNHVKLGLENLPYLEGFPDETEIADIAGDWVRPWFDIGHDYVRKTRGWIRPISETERTPETATRLNPLGVHIHDSNGGDDHLAPGDGKVDFTALKPIMIAARDHLVFEPNGNVPAERLAKSLTDMRRLLVP